jgi:Lon protease-like protein
VANPSSSTSALHLPPEWLEDLAVFPLPNVVLFPCTALSLHIFEPRYRTMMRQVLDGGRRILAVALLKPGFEANYAGAPPVYEHCGVGRFEDVEELPDGRFNFTIKGVARVRLSEHVRPDLPYRRARAEVLENQGEQQRSTAQAVTALLSTAALVATHVRRSQPQFSLGVTPDLAPGQIADVLADRLVADPYARQAILEAMDVRERVRLVTGRVADLLGELEMPPRGSERPMQ